MGKSTSAVVFPGQGTQKHGMGKDFYDNIKESREAFEEASHALGWDVASLCFGNDEKINLTEFAQPCILTTEIAMFRGLKALYGFAPDYFGGHSLGEYTALVAADAMPFSEALCTVETRGRLMQQATPPGTGSMAAVISDGLDPETIRQELSGLNLDVANINSADQIVISGPSDSMRAAEHLLRQSTAENQPFRFVPLNVSAPFHSRFMNTIRGAFYEVLAAFSARLKPENAACVTSNFTGGFHLPDAGNIIETLVAQISHSVKWRDNMQALAEKTSLIYEIGPNRPLRNFFKTIDVTCRSVTSVSSARRAFA
jgi:[acyl-carrier-protein] S-malonyltransferase/trans-AT polyketide synthase/acyltransferase/oxidoreductase domain-containing protein